MDWIEGLEEASFEEELRLQVRRCETIRQHTKTRPIDFILD